MILNRVNYRLTYLISYLYYFDFYILNYIFIVKDVKYLSSFTLTSSVVPTKT